MLFNLENTIIHRAVKVAKIFPPVLIKLINWLLFIILLSLLIAFFADKPILGLSSSSQVLGLFLIVLSLDIFNWIWLIFFATILKKNTYLKPPLEEAISFLETDKINLAKYLDFNITFALKGATSFCKRKKIFLTTLCVVLFLFKNERAKKIFEKLDLTEKNIKKELEEKKRKLKQSEVIYDSGFMKVIKEAARYAVVNFHRQIEIRDFLVAAAEHDEDFRKILFANDLETSDIDHVISWDDFINYQADWKRKFWKVAKNFKFFTIQN